MTGDLGKSKGGSPETIVKHFPRLYHMADASRWESIKKHGLLSTTALLDLFQISGERRFSIESSHRPESVTISHPKHGIAVIRDQKPMRESDLLKCLTGMSPRQWYEALNNRVFFWLTEERLIRLLKAKEYRNNKQLVLTLDTSKLLEQHSNKVNLSPLNTGCTRPCPWPRGSKTFLPLSKYPFEGRRKYGIKNTIVELTVGYTVPDIMSFVDRAQYMIGETKLETLYER